MNKLLLTTLGLVIAVGFALGCGSGEDEATSADKAPPLTKAQFIKQADAICERITKERETAIAAWQKEYTGGAAEAEENLDEGLKKVIAPSMRQEVRELEALQVPVEDGGAVNQMIANLKKGSTVIAKEGTEGIPKSGIPDYEKEAAAYGLKVCRYP